MTRYLLQPRDICKGYELPSFARNMRKNIGKNVSKDLSSKYSQKFLDHTKEPDTGTIKTALIRAIQKTAEETGNLIKNKNGDKNGNEEILRERSISSKERQKTIDDLKLI